MNARPFFTPAARFAVLAFCGLALVLAGHPAGQAQTPAPTLQLLSREGRRTLPITTSGAQEMLALDDLSRAFQLNVRDDGGAITVGYRDRTIVLTPDQTIASVAGRLISLPTPPIRTDGRWFVPLEFINRALASIYDARLDLRRASHLLVIGDIRVPRVTARVDATTATARVTLDVVPSATPAITQQGNTRLVVRLDADALDLTIPTIVAGPLVQAIRFADASSIAIDLGPRFATFKSASLPIDDGLRITIDLATDQPPETALPTPAPTTTGQAPSEPPPLDLPGNSGVLRTVVIDAGHGGDDVGAKGVSGTLEKTLALSVARRVKTSLEARFGVRVVMTRDDDRAVPIESRTALANNNKADLFLSLHANASFRPEAKGATAYVATLKDVDLGNQRVGSERMSVFGGGLRTVDIVPWSFAQIPHRAKSEEFAQTIVSALTDRVPVAPRPLEHAPLRVLESANMPAVLLEIGYLTNAREEASLAGNDLQNALAQAIVDAVGRFRESQLASTSQAGR